MSTKPKVLRVGQIEYAHERWNQLESIAEIIDCTSQSREEFIHDLKAKYLDVTCIARTFYSYSMTGKLDKEIAEAMSPTVKTLSHNGAGYDHIVVDEFTKKGIQVSNVTFPVEDPTADTAIYLMLGCMRNFQQGRELLRLGNWPNNGGVEAAGARKGNTPKGKVVGILGMGRIGRAIRDRLIPFKFNKIIYYNRNRLDPELEGTNAEYVSFDELLQSSDIIIVSMPLNESTTHMINPKTIEKMKDGVIIINIARGAIIDEQHLPKYLKSGKISSFGSDVFEKEPIVSPDLYNLPNVITLPHMGTHAIEALKYMEEWVVDNIECFINTGKVKTIVPEQYNMKILE